MWVCTLCWMPVDISESVVCMYSSLRVVSSSRNIRVFPDRLITGDLWHVKLVIIESNPFLAGSPVPCLSDDLYARCGWLEHQSDGGPHWKRTQFGPPPGLLNAACDILHLCSNSHRSKRGPS